MYWRKIEAEIIGMNRVYKLRNNRELREWIQERRKVYIQVVRVNAHFIEEFAGSDVIQGMLEFRPLIPDLREMSRDARIVLRRLDMLLEITSTHNSFTEFDTHKSKAESIHESSIRYRSKWNDIMSLSEKAHRILNNQPESDDKEEESPPFAD